MREDMVATANTSQLEAEPLGDLIEQ